MADRRAQVPAVGVVQRARGAQEEQVVACRRRRAPSCPRPSGRAAPAPLHDTDRMDDPRLPSMRAADADRERVLEVLRQGHAEGRLTTPEFYERLESVHRAKTYAELDDARPRPPGRWGADPVVRAAASPGGRAGRRPASPARLPKELRAMWVTWATVVSINVLIWLIVSVARSRTRRSGGLLLADLGGRARGGWSWPASPRRGGSTAGWRRPASAPARSRLSLPGAS